MPKGLPSPPLQRPVPQYPDPVVPDFYTKSGHIILIEKASAEVGTWNPQPLDGSITYQGIDANKFPSTLYLVYQKISEDGVFVYKYWANDRTLSSQDPWNYGLSYSFENPDYPIIERTYIILRSSYETIALGQVDPVFEGSAVIAKQAMKEFAEDNPLRSLFVQVVRVYETLPGPILVSFQYDDSFQANLKVSKQKILAGTAAPTPYNGLLVCKDDPIDSVATMRTIVEAIGGSGAFLPPERVEYKAVSYSVPRRVSSLDIQYAEFAPQDIRLRITPVSIASYSVETVARITTDFQYGQPSEPTVTDLFNPVPADVCYTGFNINFDLGSGLCDHLSYSVLTGYNGSTPIYETIEIPATSPVTATTWPSGQFKVTGRTIEYWKANIWIKRTVETLIP